MAGKTTALDLYATPPPYTIKQKSVLINRFLWYDAVMRFLGIDYGTKWIGIAISDESKQFALPYNVLENKKGVVNDIQLICEKELIDEIVLGESKNYKQEENPVMKNIREFADVLRHATHLPVFFEPEFLTSREARHMEKDEKKAHASAAAIILQSYIDRI